MPSSLTRVSPIALVFSTHPPESVCGTGTVSLARSFSWQYRLSDLRLAPRRHLSGSGSGFACHPHSPNGLTPTMSNRWAHLPCCVTPSLITTCRGTGILTRCPSPTLLSLGLGPTNPTRINLPSETSGLRRPCFSQGFRYSYRHSHFCTLDECSRSRFSAKRRTSRRVQNAPLPLHHDDAVRSFGSRLSPVILSAQDHLTSELLRTL